MLLKPNQRWLRDARDRTNQARHRVGSTGLQSFLKYSSQHYYKWRSFRRFASMSVAEKHMRMRAQAAVVLAALVCRRRFALAFTACRVMPTRHASQSVIGRHGGSLLRWLRGLHRGRNRSLISGGARLCATLGHYNNGCPESSMLLCGPYYG